MESQRKRFVGGNWKSNLTLSKVKELVEGTLNKLNINDSKCEVVVSPVSVHIPSVQTLLTNKSVKISSQNVSQTGTGAFTGEIAPSHLTDLGITWSIIGHSERRTLFHEGDDISGAKAKNALGNGVDVIYCIGETLKEREANKTFEVLAAQLTALTGNVLKEQWARVVLAYEPVWAIGTGKTATPEIAQEAHAYIRKWVSENVDKDIANAVRIIYGGSVNDKNCGDLIKQGDIDGFLVGGASIQPAFSTIVDACNQ